MEEIDIITCPKKKQILNEYQKKLSEAKKSQFSDQ